ncbi:AAA family ATPase [Paracoccus laeviglucosivorans]|uniref:Exonuclease SbcC n=1 Tax=Paracoccus laeviglucosivorans TaxID=1197861 RepID=A0A521FUP1_9RHOB|nr:SMC family ATPase [Paracoccus laeviglucosivorans]SMO99280.1 exonuclease SbcC [Paracoccus laeviglucosivorans]
MRPIRLTLQAFGPFATTEIIDFRSALEIGLFGIYGQTGAGKSTLFSAMVFALFGAPTKADQEPRSLRSDHAAADLPTEVEFLFELGAKSYLIRRRPVQERPKARGAGMTADAAEAALFDVTGIAPDLIGSGQSGRVLAEKKVSVVDKQLRELLGYGPDQFRQIVLLPQGRFETFLAAKTDARVEILRELFDVKIYRDLAARLKDEAAQAERALREQRALYLARLIERGFESAEALEIGITAATAQVEEARGRQQAEDAAQLLARAGLAEGERLEKAFVAADGASKALEGLEAKAAVIGHLERRVETVSNALHARDLETAWHDAAAASREAVASVTTAAADLETALQARDFAEQTLEAARAGEERLRAVQADLTRLKEVGERVGQAADLQAAFDRTSEDAAKAAQALTAADAARETLLAQRDAADLALEQARRAEASRSQLTAELAGLDHELARAAALAKATAAVAEAEGRIEMAAGDLAARIADGDATDTALTEAEARLTRTQAIILAEKLTEGAPCPVCGGTDHPAPAQGSPEQSGLTEAFRKAQAAARAAAEAKVRAETELTNCRRSCNERRQAAAEMDRPTRPQAELEADKARLDVALTAIGAALDLETMAARLADLKQEVAQAETAATTARIAASTAAQALAGAAARRDAVVDALPEGLRTPEAVAGRRTALQGEETRLAEALERAVQGDRAAAEALTRAQELLAAAQRMQEAQTGRAARAQVDFTARLHEVGLDEGGYAACKAHFPTLGDDRKAVRDHQDGLIAARTTLQYAQADCAGCDRPDLEQLVQVQAAAAERVRAAMTALAEAESAVEGLTVLRGSLSDALARTEVLEAETGPLRGLADLANGKNDFNMTLETFAIAAMFDQVLEAANMRFDPMTRGRYRLERAVEASGGRGKRGLGIDVFDINTGKARPTATLSGGETFISALALALGLADVVESLSGKVRMDTIFIDEGFGSLDTENGAGTLDQVLQVLAELTEGSRAVGLISHVGLVQETIPQGFYVRSTPSGSRVEERRGLG